MLSGLLPEPQLSLAVMGICVQIVSMAFMVPLGVSIALRIRVSNLLGAEAALSCHTIECPRMRSAINRTEQGQP